MKIISAFVTTYLIAAAFALADNAADQALLKLCRTSDAVVHIHVDASPDTITPDTFTVTKVTLVRVLKKVDSLPGEVGVQYALTVKRPGDIINERDWQIRRPGDYVTFCRLPLGDNFMAPSRNSAPLLIWSLYQDNDAQIKDACDKVAKGK